MWTVENFVFGPTRRKNDHRRLLTLLDGIVSDNRKGVSLVVKSNLSHLKVIQKRKE